jgi:hypothetical protein
LQTVEKHFLHHVLSSERLQIAVTMAIGEQGCQMVYFKTPYPNLGKFWLVHSMAIWNILRPFGIFYGHLVYFTAISYFSSNLVCCVKKDLATLVARSTECTLGQGDQMS